MTSRERCPTCGMKVKVVGKTTMHYEPDLSEYIRKEDLPSLEDIRMIVLDYGVSPESDEVALELSTAIHQRIMGDTKDG